uniref:Uncharacterized protein n=1 Tax=Arundo donax TaxID=35708 RepID=A0A0A9BWD6_ARUDO
MDYHLQQETTLLLLCANFHWAAINISSIPAANDDATSLCAFTRADYVHNSTLQAGQQEHRLTLSGR